MEFPIDVFVDTQIYENQSFDISEKGRLELLKKQVKKGAIKLLTSEIVVQEVRKHIKDNIEKRVDEINKKYKSRELAIFRNSRYENYFKELDSQELVEEALSMFEGYLSDAKAFFLDINTVAISEVLEDYFSGRKPFGSKIKKSEFPDAFNISMMKKYKKKDTPIYVLSGDNDFQDIEGIYVYKTIDELLNIINLEEVIAQQALKYIVDTYKPIVEEDIKEKFFENEDSLEIDGYEYDRKGILGGYDYEEIYLESVTPISCTRPEVIDYDSEDQTVIISMQYMVEFTFDCTFFDENNSIWDSEDKEYYYKEYGNIRENHTKEIEVKVNLYYEYSSVDLDSYPEFIVDSIEVDTYQKFTQSTLNKKGREILNSPRLVYDDYCPDCGCGLTFSNDSGSGFCINCVQNH